MSWANIASKKADAPPPQPQEQGGAGEAGAGAEAAAAPAAAAKVNATMQYLLVTLRGALVRLRTAAGEVYDGLLDTVEGAGDAAVVALLEVQRVPAELLAAEAEGAKRRNRSPFVERLAVPVGDLASLVLAPAQPGGVAAAPSPSAAASATAAAPGAKAGGPRAGFRTDTEISARDRRERRLARFECDDSGALGDELERPGGHAGKWDQFKTNEEKFNVKTTFNFDDYSTKLDKNSEFYKRNERYAERLERDIMRTKSRSVHVAEERGQDISGMAAGKTEEDMYSTVDRAPSPKAGVYQNPHRRASPAAAPAAKKAEAAPVPPAKKDGAGDGGEEKAKPKKSLNPNAKEFTFNPSASAFVPGGGAPAAAPVPHANPAAAAAIAAAMSAASAASRMPMPMQFPPGAVVPGAPYMMMPMPYWAPGQAPPMAHPQHHRPPPPPQQQQQRPPPPPPQQQRPPQ